MKKDTSVNIRLTSELRAALQRLADEDGRKLSAYIERLLQLHVRAASHEGPASGGGSRPELAPQPLRPQGLMEEAAPYMPPKGRKRE